MGTHIIGKQDLFDRVRLNCWSCFNKYIVQLIFQNTDDIEHVGVNNTSDAGGTVSYSQRRRLHDVY